MSPVTCSKECPPGESRGSPGVPRQVCRCPPKETPLAFSRQSLPLMSNEGGDGDGDVMDDSGKCKLVAIVSLNGMHFYQLMRIISASSLFS